MMSRNTYLISGVAALVVLGGGLMFWQMPSGDSTPDEPVRVLTQPAKPQAVLPAAAPQPNVPEPAFSDLTLRYRNAKDFRAFLLYLKQHPEKGGGYYANHIGSLCGSDLIRANNSLPYQDTVKENYARRAAAFSRLKSLCQSFLAGDHENMRFHQDWKEIYEKDRLLALTNKAAAQTNPPMNPEQRAEYKKALLQSSDAIFHGALGAALAYNRSADGQSEYWLNGHRISSSGPENQDMRMAFNTVRFELGLASDGSDPESVVTCVLTNFCYDNPDEYIRHAMQSEPPEGREDRIQRVIQWRKQIGAAILAKDVAFFLPR
ncbi:hypothetical protein [Undibacterium squillarum]|uniref:hypothetical protein n=1 Tax=Undibacterium squillarum TaxID=1131567 RepID=UPI0035B0F006